MEIKKSWKVKLSILDKRIDAFKAGYRQNIAILGLDIEEISYLLDNYLLENKYSEFFYIRVSPIYKNSKDFFKDIAISFFSEYSNRIENLDYFLLNLEGELPLVVNFIRDVLKKDNINFFDVVNLIDKFINQTNKKYIFLIEEFTELDKIFNSWHQAFVKFIMLQRDCMVVLTSSDILKAEKILSWNLNLLFGNFEKIYTDEISFIDRYLYLKSSLSFLSPSDFFISFLLNILGNNLIHYDLIIDIIKNNYEKTDEINSLIRILEESLYRRDGYFYQKYIKQLELLKERFFDYQSIVKLLFALASGYLRKTDLASLNIYDTKTIKVKLDKLCSLNYIVNFGNIYKIYDCLFAFWLLNVFKINILFLNLQKRYFFWRQNIEKDIIRFKDRFSRSRIEKIKELLSSFRNDIIYINKIKYILPAIEKIELIPSPVANLYFLIPKENIFLAIKEDITEDNDIFEFLKITNKYKQNKRIFICTKEVSNSAKLLAKNHKLLTLDYNDINFLFSIYKLDTLILEKDLVKNEGISNF